MVKKGQLTVSKIDSPEQRQDLDPNAPKIKRRGDSRSHTRARPQSQGSSSKG
jgi:hypothetical protein